MKMRVKMGLIPHEAPNGRKFVRFMVPLCGTVIDVTPTFGPNGPYFKGAGWYWNLEWLERIDESKIMTSELKIEEHRGIKSKDEILKGLSWFGYIENVPFVVYKRNDVLVAMEEYAKPFKQSWISVEDEKPEINLPVIIYLPEAPCQFQCQIAAYDGNLFRPFSNKKRKLLKINSYYEMESITHWMPLPEPPNTEQ